MTAAFDGFKFSGPEDESRRRLPIRSDTNGKQGGERGGDLGLGLSV